MIISFARVLLSAGIILQLLAQPSTLAQDPPITIESSVDYQYADHITFRALIQPSHNVARAAVLFRPHGSTDTTILLASFDPDNPSLASASHDLQAAPLPPFSEVVYWWHVDLTDGSSQTFEPQTFHYTDNRFEWTSLNQPPLTVYWADGDLDLAQAAIDISQEALQRLSRSLYLEAPDTLRVYLYPSIEELQTGLQLVGRTWAGAHAATDLGLVLLPVPPGAEARPQLERDLPHELTHVLLYHRMGSTYANLPTWLNEGLAILNEADPQPRYRIALETAISDKTLLPLPSLCSAFPTEGTQALLAYSESASLVQYIQDIYGTGAILALLDAYQEGASCLGALQRVFQRSSADFEAEYRAYLSPTADFWASLGPYTSVILTVLLILLAAVVATLVLRRRPDW